MATTAKFKPSKYTPVYISDNLYDALHLSALAFGGVGAGDYRDYDDRDECGQAAPFCIAGHALFVTFGDVTLDHLIRRNDEVVPDNGKRMRWDTYVRKMNLHPMREKPVRAA